MIFVVAGPLHAGKTTRVERLAASLRTAGRLLAGFVTPAVREGSGIAGYDLRVMGSDEAVPFLRRDGGGTWQRTGPFFFIPEALARAREAVLNCGRETLLVVDEVGPAELAGRGVWPELRSALEDPGRDVLIVVRESLLERLSAKLRRNYRVLRFDEAGLEARVLKELGR